jgi:DNA-binding transcriptional LysR family regulator
MELRIIDYFLAVAEHGTVTAAAQACYITQPSLSRQIASLEKSFGFPLFDRSAEGMRLNRAGQRFYPIARDIRSRVEQGLAVMDSLGAGELSLSVACPPTVLEHLLAPFMAGTGSIIGDVTEVAPGEVYELLDRADVDIAFGTSEPQVKFSRRSLMTAMVAMQCRADSNPFAGRDTVDIAELQDHPVLSIRPGSAIRRSFDSAAAARKIRFSYRNEVSSTHVAQALAAAGRGIAIGVGPARYSLDRIPITSLGAPVTITDWMAWDPDHYAASEIRATADHLVEWLSPRMEYLGMKQLASEGA